jgi:S1-C subfamily serine protease
VEVRVPSPSGRARAFRGQVLKRDRDVDTSLIRLRDVPAGGLPSVAFGRSDALEVGQFALALGNAFDEEGLAPPSLTAGIVSGLQPLPPGRPGGAFEFVFTGAAVNEGVNGGPVVDLDGRLVATVSTFLDPEPSEPYQFLGKAIPLARIQAALADVPEAQRVFQRLPAPVVAASTGRALEATFRAAVRRAEPALVSLVVERAKPIASRFPFESEDGDLRRFGGAATGFVVSAEGWILTALYNLTNVGELVEPLWEVYARSDVPTVAQGLADVRSVTAWFTDGRSAPARIVGTDERLGVALLKADLPAGAVPPPAIAPAAPEAYQAGRFVLALGDPFGAERVSDPLVTLGILSRFHPADTAAPWRGQWQTDAAGLDTNAGGPAVDLEGRLLGLLTIWHPLKHGRNSGIAFVVPWPEIEAALPALKAGSVRTRGMLGIRFADSPLPIVESVVPDSGGARVGLAPGDLIREIDRETVGSSADVAAAIRFRFEGEQVRVTWERGGRLTTGFATLGPR